MSPVVEVRQLMEAAERLCDRDGAATDARNQIVARQLRVDQARLEDAFPALTGRGTPENQGAQP
jgi:hypothetical protein